MPWIRLAESWYVNPDALAWVEFSGQGDGLEASVVFVWGEKRILKGSVAQDLQKGLEGTSPISESPDTGSQFAAQLAPAVSHLNPSILNDRPARKKAWFCRTDADGRVFILAFVNREQSCTVRTFEAKNGTFLAKLAGIGSYRDCFADLLANAIELSVPYQPNLDRNCKDRLPEPIMTHLRRQIEALGLARPA
jgi:hypothetical protein